RRTIYARGQTGGGRDGAGRGHDDGEAIPDASLRRAAMIAVVAYLVALEPLCASVNADGSVFDDGCGTCNEATAARWSPAQVSFKFDRTTLPSNQGVSTQ